MDSARPNLLLGRPVRPGLRRAAAVATVATLAVIGVIVFQSGPPDAAGQRSLLTWLSRLHEEHPITGFITFGLIEWLANVVMFVPLALFSAAMCTVPGRRWIVPGAALLSIAIETAQTLFLPNRVGAVSDVVANTVGAALGVLLLAAVSRSRLVRARPVDA